MLEDAWNLLHSSVFVYDNLDDGMQQGDILRLVSILRENHKASKQVSFGSLDLVCAELLVQLSVNFLFVSSV